MAKKEPKSSYEVVVIDSTKQTESIALARRRKSYRHFEFHLSTNWRALTVTSCRFEDCIFVAKKRLRQFDSWTRCHLLNCRFVGDFRDNGFGMYKIFKPHGSIENCDFSRTKLDGCRFYACDPKSLSFPEDGTLVICEPFTNLNANLLAEAPIEIQKYLSLFPEDEELTAYCVEAQLAEKEYGIQIESLMDLLKKHHVRFFWQTWHG